MGSRIGNMTLDQSEAWGIRITNIEQDQRYMIWITKNSSRIKEIEKDKIFDSKIR